MKRQRLALIVCVVSLLFGAAALAKPSVPQGLIPTAESDPSLWANIDGDALSDTTSILADLTLIAGMATMLDSCGNGKPYYTFFAPGDQVMEAALDALGGTVADLQSSPATVKALLNDHLVNGSFSPEQLSMDNVSQITARSGFTISVSDDTPQTPNDRLLGSNVKAAGHLILDWQASCNGFLYGINGFIDSTPQDSTDGFNPSDPFTLTWTSPSSPSSSRHQLFELSFSHPVSTSLTSSDFENVGTQVNCSFSPIAENAPNSSQKFFLLVSCPGTGTVRPRLTLTELTTLQNGQPKVESVSDTTGGNAVDIVNGFVLTIEKVGSGGGSVFSNISGVDCGVMCVGVFTRRTAITLTAIPAPGSAFVGWSGACTGTAPCRLNVAASVNVTAQFEPAAKISVLKAGGGSGVVSSSPSGVNCALTSSSTCSGWVAAGTQVTLQARANRGSRFVGWMGACTGTSTCTFWTQYPGQVIHVFPIFE